MIILKSKTENIIRAEGELAYPNECCGVLIGSVDDGTGNKIIQKIEPIKNARDDGEEYHRFLITPQDLMNAERTARALGLDVLGFYHSHPDHPSAPSEFDREHALPFYSYVIISVNKGKADELTSWELKFDRTEFVPEQISTAEDFS